MKFWQKKTLKITSLIGPVIITVLVLVLFWANYIPGTWLTGWDNVHPEFSLGDYTRRVIFGAWQEQMGTGGPAAQGYSSEIFRMPIIFLLKLILPMSMIRYTYVFLTLWVGGLGMYYYLKNYWLATKTEDDKISKYAPWLATFGAIFYILNPFTLQQYYIIFEMFGVKFAMLPWLLMVIHKLADKFNTKHLLLFFIVQILIAPSAHTQTVFYLGMLFSCVYVLFINFKISQIWKSFRFATIIFGLTLFANSYWFIPNVYFAANNSHYLVESRANRIFNFESLWSIRSAGDWESFFTGIHYLFQWKDYNFATQEHEFIFAEWDEYYKQNPVAKIILVLIGVSIVLGLILTVLDKRLGTKRWAVVITYLGSISLIWIDLFPTKFLIELLYKNSIFFEMFRNPFTKLNMLLAFLWPVLMIQVLVTIIWLVGKQKTVRQSWLVVILLAIVTSGVFVSMRPAFQSQLINEKLRVTYPEQYFEMFEYMRTRNRHYRTLELPHFSNEWEYYRWEHNGQITGYQGMGFRSFGSMQPVLNVDFARWIGATDSFYHELGAALDSRDSQHLREIFDKYQVQLIIVDDSRIDQYFQDKNYPSHQVLLGAGFESVWNRENLSIYERTDSQEEGTYSNLMIPTTYSVIANQLERVYEDVIYRQVGDYIVSDSPQSLRFPFADLFKERLSPADMTENAVVFKDRLPAGSFNLVLPQDKYPTRTVAELVHLGNQIKIKFPELNLEIGETEINLFGINEIEASASGRVAMVEIDEEKVTMLPGQNKYISVDLSNKRFRVKVGELSSSVETSEYLYLLDRSFAHPQMTVRGGGDMKLRSEFPWAEVDLNRISTNCGLPEPRGYIETDYQDGEVTYYANEYGVNCTSNIFDHTNIQTSLLVNVVGENVLRRSTKLFVSDEQDQAIIKQYLLPLEEYSVVLGLPRISSDVISKYAFDWETRSFKSPSVNRMSKFAVVPFPLELVSQIKLVPEGVEEVIDNDLTVVSHWSPDVTFHLLEVECFTPTCIFAIDQSYDDLWWAVDLNSFSLLHHTKLNSWANAWIVNDSGKILIIYLPEVLQLLALVSVIAVTIILTFRWIYISNIKQKK